MAVLDSLVREEKGDPNRGDMPAGILRQRRNLLVISLALIALYYSGAKLEFSNLEVFGVSVTLKRPEVIADFWFLWIGWAYLMLRYVQYLGYYEVGAEIRRTFEGEAGFFLTRGLKQKISKECPEYFDGDRQYVTVQHIKRSGLKFEFLAGGYVDGRYADDRHRTKVGAVPVVYAYIIAAISDSIKGRYFSDYYLPFIVAATPVVQAFSA